MLLRQPQSTRTYTLFPYTTRFRSGGRNPARLGGERGPRAVGHPRTRAGGGQRALSAPPGRAANGRPGKTQNPKGILSGGVRSEETTSELQTLMRISYAVLCLKKKKTRQCAEYHIFIIVRIES